MSARTSDATPTDAKQRFAAARAELCSRYRALLPDKLRAIEAELERTRCGDGPSAGGASDAWEEAWQQSHQLAGSAGSFGCTGVGDAARALERVLLAGRAGGSRDGAAADRALAALRAAVAEDVAGG